MNNRLSSVPCLLVLLTLFAPQFSMMSSAQDAAPAKVQSDIDSRRARLLSLFDEEWQYELRSDPETATSLGDNRYNDRLADRSPQFYQSDREAKSKFLAQFEAIDSTGLSTQDALSREVGLRA